MPIRYDNLKLKKVELKKDMFGFVTLPANVTRTGIFTYRKADGTVIKELRHPKEVLKSDSLDTLKQKPVSNEHPICLVNSKNIKDHIVGTTGEKINILDSDNEGIKFINIKTSIYDNNTIQDIENGKSEVSCGYNCDIEFTPGEFNGEHYDAIQKNIKYNHVAVVNRGRAGREVKLKLDSLKLDSEDAILVSDSGNKESEVNMSKIKIGADEFDCEETLVAAIQKKDQLGKTEMDKKDQEIMKLKEEIKKLKEGKKDNDDSDKTDAKKDEIQAKLDHLTQENTELKTKITNMDAEIVKKTNSRIKLYNTANEICDDETVNKLDSMTELEIKKAIISTQTKTDLSDKTDTYIDARFDMIVENLADKNDHDVLGTKILNLRSDTNCDYGSKLSERLANNYKSN